MSAIASSSGSFGKSSAAQAIGPLTDKLGDLKLKKPAGDALIVFAEKTSLGFVLSQGETSACHSWHFGNSFRRLFQVMNQ
jgi:hypothetical protein